MDTLRDLRIETAIKAADWIERDSRNRAEDALRDLLAGFRALLSPREEYRKPPARWACSCGSFGEDEGIRAQHEAQGHTISTPREEEPGLRSPLESAARALARAYWRGRQEEITQEQEDEFWLSFAKDAKSLLASRPSAADWEAMRQSYENKVQDFANETLRSSRLCTLLAELREPVQALYDERIGPDCPDDEIAPLWLAIRAALRESAKEGRSTMNDDRKALAEGLSELARKVHDFDQEGPWDDHRFETIEDDIRDLQTLVATLAAPVGTEVRDKMARLLFKWYEAQYQCNWEDTKTEWLSQADAILALTRPDVEALREAFVAGWVGCRNESPAMMSAQQMDKDNKHAVAEALRRFPGGDGWVSVKERLPEIGAEVWICGAGEQRVAAPELHRTVVRGSRQAYSSRDPEKGWSWLIGGYYFAPEQITHWMDYTPSPPRDGEEKKG